MSDPYVGQLMLVGFNFPPVGWAYAAGQILSISQNTALFSLLGTYYGGNGTSNFALPNLQGNLAIGQGRSAGLSMYSLGETGGTGTVTLTSQTVPAHTHALQCAGGKPKENTPLGNAVANAAEVGQLFSTSVTPVSPMSTSAVSFFGSGQPHTNMMPYLALNWVIALQGIYPTRN